MNTCQDTFEPRNAVKITQDHLSNMKKHLVNFTFDMFLFGFQTLNLDYRSVLLTVFSRVFL